MSERTFTFPVASLRRIPDPIDPKTRDTYIVVCKTNAVPPDLPLDPDPREQNLKTKVAKAIEEGLTKDLDQKFHLLNRGITISAKEVRFNNAKNKVSIIMDDGSEEHGIVDGGHTFKIITRHREDPKINQYVKLEIMTAIEDNISEIARARNTSVQVQEKSLANLQGHFDWIKDILRKQPFKNQIAYVEFEPGDVDIRDIIGLLTLFNLDLYPDDRSTHPIEAYSSKAKCVTKYLENMETYKKLDTVLLDILELYDYIQLKLPEIHKATRGLSGESSRGAYGKLMEIGGKRKKSKMLYFLGKDVDYDTPEGWVYPILGGLRFLLREQNGKFQWKVTDPKRFFDQFGPQLLEITIETSKNLGRKPNAVGKSRSHWGQLYDKVKVSYMELLDLKEQTKVIKM